MPQFREIINVIDRLRDHQGAVVCWGFFFFLLTATLHDWNNLLLYLVLILESEHFWYKITLGILNTFYVQVKARETSFRDPKAPWMSHISFCSKSEPQSFNAQGKKSVPTARQWGEHTASWMASQIWVLALPGLAADRHCSLNHPHFTIQGLLEGQGGVCLKTSLPPLDCTQLEKQAWTSHWEWALLIWEASPATAFTPVTFTPALNAARSSAMWEGGKKQFSEFGLAGLWATETMWLLQQEATVHRGAPSCQRRNPAQWYTCLVFLRHVSDHDGTPVPRLLPGAPHSEQSPGLQGAFVFLKAGCSLWVS